MPFSSLKERFAMCVTAELPRCPFWLEWLTAVPTLFGLVSVAHFSRPCTRFNSQSL